MKQFCFVAALLLLTTNMWAQEFSLGYGNITNHELTMTVYENDTSAVAVVLYEHAELYYEFTNNRHVGGFQIVYELRRKIKILKPEGVEYGDIGIVYYKSDSQKGIQERITGIEATAYNLENGRVIKTKLNRKYIFDEALGNQYRMIKFSIPNVRVGTVIEYRYRKTSDNVFEIPDWNMQDDIPVLNSTLEALIPEFFVFNVSTRGFEHIHVERTNRSETFRIGHNIQPLPSNSQFYKFSAQNLPAMRNEPHVWYLNDFKTAVRFELRGTRFPNDYYRPYTRSWADIEFFLRRDTNFGTNIRMSNPFRAETRAIIAEVSDEEERIKQIYGMVKDRIRWNGTYSLIGNDARQAVRNGIGNNGQINMVLLSALRDADIKAFPVLMSRRSLGRIPHVHPSLRRLNTFIVGAETSTGKRFYMDGSAEYAGLNTLPIDLLVDRAYVFDERIANKWVDLTGIANNQRNIRQRIEIDKNGQISGERNIRHLYQFAYQIKQQYRSEEDSIRHIEQLQGSSRQFAITEVNLEGNNRLSNLVQERIKFVSNQENDSEFIYINPLLLAPIENPFLQTERRLPIEFDFPYTVTVRTMLVVPENYRVEEIPEQIAITMGDDAGVCIYQITHNDNVIHLNFQFRLNQIIFPAEDYAMIRDFFGKVATKSAELIVLRRL